MSASWSTQRLYSGAWYWVEKMMLRKSLPVMRTHSWASRAPIGWNAVKPGMSESAMSMVACTSSMRGSVS